MPKATTSSSYNAVAKALHWLIAYAIIAMLIIGWTMKSMANGSDKFALFQLHKSLGITILALSLIRLLWRLIHQAPPLPAKMPTWEKFAARGTHWLFYILIIGMPLTGWAIVSSSTRNIPTILWSVTYLIRKHVATSLGPFSVTFFEAAAGAVCVSLIHRISPRAGLSAIIK